MASLPPIAELTALERATLLTMALWQEDLSQSKWFDMVRATGVKNSKDKALTFADIKEAIQALHQQGWLVQALGAGYQLDLRFNLERLFLAYNFLLEHENVRAWVALTRSWLPNHYYRPYLFKQPREFYRREIWLAMLGGELDKLPELEKNYLEANPDTGHFPLNALADAADGTALVAKFPAALQQHLLYQALVTATFDLPDCAHLPDYTAQQLTTALAEDPVFVEFSGWYLLVRGEFTQLAELQDKAPDLTLGFTAPLTLLQGDYPAALAQFGQLIKLQKQLSGGKAKQLTQLLGWLHLLCLFVSDANTHAKAIKAQLNALKQPRFNHCVQLFLLLLQHVTSPGSVNSDEVRMRFPKPQGSGIEGLFSALCLYWLDALSGDLAQQWLSERRQWLFDAEYTWVAAEFDALCASAFGIEQLQPSWHTDHNLTPLCQMFQPQERWQTLLAALGHIGRVDNQTSQTKDSRIVWVLRQSSYSINIEPREQKRSAKGQWGTGRAVALRRLQREPESVTSLTSADHAVIKCIESYEQGFYSQSCYELNPNKALHALVGHPLVFWEDALDAPVAIKRSNFYLQLQQQGGNYQLTLQPDELLAQQRLWREETPTSLLVYAYTTVVRDLNAVLGKGLTVPAQGKAKLLASIEHLAAQIAIHSDVTELTASIHTVPANTQLYGHLLPWQQGLRLQILLQPLAQGAWFKPGKGSANLVGELDGAPVQTNRDLAHELQQLNQLVQRCPALTAAEYDGHQWLLAEPELCLELLEQLQQLPDGVCHLVWPEGETMRIRRRASARDFALNLRQQSQWLHLDGELALDQDRVLTLKELLELVTSSNGRFVALGANDYLALTASFRQQLTDMAALATKSSRDGVQLSTLSAPLVSEWAEQAGKVQSNKGWQQLQTRMNDSASLQPALPSTLQTELRDYQQQGFAWLSRLAHWGVGACLADDMGLGKTIQTLALLLARAAGGPALVVAPVSVATNWRSEAAKFAPTLRVHWYHEVRDIAQLQALDVVICSYGLLQADIDNFTQTHWHTVVLDEAQAIKNDQTKRAKAALALHADFRMIATGTPIENHLGELWSLFQFINPGLLGTKEQFQRTFVTPIEQGDSNARQLLKKLVQPFVLRRTKSQVLQELPARTEIQLEVELSHDERHWYEALRQQSLDKLADATDGQAVQVLAEIMRLRRFCCHPNLVLPEKQLSGSKLAVFADTLSELLANQHKVLVFSQFVDHLAIVRRYLDEQQVSYQYLDGATAVPERKKRVDAFQSGQGEVFLISLKAGGSGLNLTAADYVIHLDPWWNPAVEDQASDRAHRLGQTRPVTIYRLVTQNTIEHKILALHSQKRELADSLLDGGDVAGKLDTAQLLELIRSAGH